MNTEKTALIAFQIPLQGVTAINEASSSHIEKVHMAAKMYIGLGIHVIPVVPNGKAIPYNGINYSDASTDEKTINGWFNSVDGIYRGYNIGIVPHIDGVFVLDIDIDIKKGKDGRIDLASLDTNGDRHETPRAETPSGGEHYFFLYQEGMTSSTDKLGRGIDTRGCRNNKPSSHVVAWPSMIDGIEYTWTKGGDFAALPDWVTKISGAWRPPVGNRGNEGVTEGDEYSKITNNTVDRMLAAIDPAVLSYEEWLRVGMALHSQNSSVDGMNKWNEWSQRDSIRYKENGCQAKWKTFKAEGISIGSLVWMAGSAGWKPTSEDKFEFSGIDDVVMEYNKQYAMVRIGDEYRILRENDYPDMEGRMYYVLGISGFRVETAGDKALTQDGSRSKEVNKSEIWLSSPKRRSYPMGMGIYPNMDCPKGTYNEWRGINLVPVPGKHRLYLDHVLNIICRGDEPLYEYVLDWMALMIQKPGERPGTALVMRGQEGVGKGIFASPLVDIMAPYSVHITSTSSVVGKFNSGWASRVLVFADELEMSGSKQAAGRLKSMVTESFVTLERKGIDTVQISNSVSLIISSNNKWVIPAGTSSRRWVVLDVPNTKMRDYEYFDGIIDEMDNGGKEGLAYMLMHRGITHNLKDAPRTDALLEIEQEYKERESSLISWLKYMVNVRDANMPGWGEWDFEDGAREDSRWPCNVPKGEVFQVYTNWCRERNKEIEHVAVAGKDLVSLGFKNGRIKDGGGRANSYIFPTIEELTQILVNAGYMSRSKDEDEDEDA